MGYGTPSPTPAQDHTNTRKYMATIHPAYTPYYYTQASYPPIYFLTPRNEQDPPRLGAHTHTQQPIDHSHQGAARNNPPVYTDNSQYYY
jgi:hypothetical protein